MAGIPEEFIEKALHFCKMNLEWPPSVAEFIRVCEKESGVPSLEEVYRSAMKRNFTHPVIEAVFNLVGSWSFKNDGEKALRDKVASAYQATLAAQRMRINKENK